MRGELPQRLRWWRAARRSSPPLVVAPPLVGDVDPRTLALPLAAHPAVCVIVPAYGQAGYTLRCLAAIAACPPRTECEVMVVEDCSGDPAMAVLRGIPGLRYEENTENLGFLRSCNAAARRTDAEFLLFLNNDTEVLPGWLDALVDLLRARPDAGAAGSKLLFPDGTLQEAGGIIWRDGSGWNYGRGDDPRKPVYNYVREADYVSGAALLVRRALFARLGGFDTAYAPAYCEDSDLAFRLREAGYVTLYQPRSAIVHFEGVTHGTDLNAGLKAYQVANQAKLRARFADVLARDHFPSGTHVLRARDRAPEGGDRRVVLVVDHYVPQPDRDAGSRTMLAFLRALLEAGRVVKFRPDNGAHSDGYTEALHAMGIETITGPGTAFFDRWLHENGADIDGVLLSRPQTAAGVLPQLRRHMRGRIAYYGHDLHFVRMRRQADFCGDPALAREARRMEKLERRIWRAADAVLYPSAAEAREVVRLVPRAAAHMVIPYAFTDFGAERTPPAGGKILFVAGFAHPPNEDAAIWFVNDILKLIRAAVPAAELHIVGSNPTARVRALAGEGIRLAADVSDAELAGFYAEARVAAVPLRFGAGVKLKVVEALAAGLPLVTTPVGAEGCDGLGGVIPVTASPPDFAAAVLRLLTDDAAWRAASAAQIAYARTRFSPAALRRSLLETSGL